MLSNRRPSASNDSRVEASIGAAGSDGFRRVVRHEQRLIDRIIRSTGPCGYYRAARSGAEERRLPGRRTRCRRTGAIAGELARVSGSTQSRCESVQAVQAGPGERELRGQVEPAIPSAHLSPHHRALLSRMHRATAAITRTARQAGNKAVASTATPRRTLASSSLGSIYASSATAGTCAFRQPSP